MRLLLLTLITAIEGAPSPDTSTLEDIRYIFHRASEAEVLVHHGL